MLPCGVDKDACDRSSLMQLTRIMLVRLGPLIAGRERTRQQTVRGESVLHVRYLRCLA